jgi:hypothetical protein
MTTTYTERIRFAVATITLATGVALTAHAQGVTQQGVVLRKTVASTRIATASDTGLAHLANERQRAPWESAAGDDSVPFVISASGGISLGSYQAGVTWALGRLTRLLADSARIRSTLRLGQPLLAAATGASAGNVNAVLSAIEWCSAAPASPEQSLFWRVWVNVGWPELFPTEDLVPGSDDYGVFDRGYFRNTLYKDIGRRMDTTAVLDRCSPGGHPNSPTCGHLKIPHP